MKRIIDGVTYNTDTSTAVARWVYEDDKGYEIDATLYHSRLGAFFIVDEWVVDDRTKNSFEAISRDEVDRLILRVNNIEIIDSDILQEPPEAAAETSPGATLYIRVPASLKNRVEKIAVSEKQSVNAWATRCMERCTELDEIGGLLGGLLQTVRALDRSPDGAGFQIEQMLRHTGSVAERIAKLLGWSDKEIEQLTTNAGATAATLSSPC